MDFVGRVYKNNKFEAYDIVMNADDRKLLEEKKDANGTTRIRLAFGKSSGKPYMAINDWKPEKKGEGETQQEKEPEKVETQAEDKDDSGLPF